ncbi:hypothetical protein HNR23_003857 [Nocardiopsis mwathae]|uniref:DUF4190 domain-containing protein n=1 Tax=Nocardiopsis mwathae TaxID=1472723 RepID=A0A7W9YKN4_9ACTN|nr:hypothetical protein [Nocardiopsis mwathae]MBB6173797.1 hypothetical protein [Nocardiopsis mwathae]
MSAQWPDPQQGHWNRPTGGYEPQAGGQPGTGWGQASPHPAYPPPYMPGYPAPYPGGGPVEEPPSTGGLVGAMIVAVVTAMLCSGTNLVGIVLGAIALAKRTSEPAEARKLTKYTWICNWIHIGILLLVIGFFAVVIAFA